MRIVIPLDGSPLAQQVLPHTRELGLRLSLQVELITVVELTSPSITWNLNQQHETIAYHTVLITDYLNAVAGRLQSDAL